MLNKSSWEGWASIVGCREGKKRTEEEKCVVMGVLPELEGSSSTDSLQGYYSIVHLLHLHVNDKVRGGKVRRLVVA